MATHPPMSTRAGLHKARSSSRSGPVPVNDPALPSAEGSRERPHRGNGSPSNSRLVRPGYGSAEIMAMEVDLDDFKHRTNVDFFLDDAGTLINPTRLFKLTTRAKLRKEVRQILKSNFRPDGFAKLRIHIRDQENVPGHMRREYHYVDITPGMDDWPHTQDEMHLAIRIPVNLKIQIIC